MINRLAIAIQAAGLNHKQIKSVLIGDLPEQAGQSYPLMRIWPAAPQLNSEGSEMIYKLVVAITDRHQDNPISQLEALSDTSQILLDVLASLQYNYKGTGIRWFIADTIEHGYDAEPDIVAGSTVAIQAAVQYARDFCQVPSNDYAFPNMNLDLITILDGGDFEIIENIEIVDGGTF